MTTPRIAVSSRIHRRVLERLRSRGEVVGNRALQAWTPEELTAKASHAHALLAFMPDRADDEMLKRCPGLGIVACALQGYDNFDVEACSRRGVWLAVVPDLLTIPTAELAVGLLIALSRNIESGSRPQWCASARRPRSRSGSTRQTRTPRRAPRSEEPVEGQASPPSARCRTRCASPATTRWSTETSSPRRKRSASGVNSRSVGSRRHSRS